MQRTRVMNRVVVLAFKMSFSSPGWYTPRVCCRTSRVVYTSHTGSTLAEEYLLRQAQLKQRVRPTRSRRAERTRVGVFKRRVTACSDAGAMCCESMPHRTVLAVVSFSSRFRLTSTVPRCATMRFSGFSF